ncbi:MAG: response regulator, partial [Vicinamibacterales bacterium]
VQARIFEPLFTTKPQGEGTGFGLATVYGIVKQSGGFISVSSAPGRGSVFDIHLPTHAARSEIDTRPEPVLKAATSTAGETVLVVEDDNAVRRLARDVLTAAGYTVIDARDGDEALARTRAHPSLVDLVITDVVMPGPTGRELAARLADAFPGIRVLYTSGYTKAATMTAGIDVTAPFLPKPFLPADLLTKVREVLSGATRVRI